MYIIKSLWRLNGRRIRGVLTPHVPLSRERVYERTMPSACESDGKYLAYFSVVDETGERGERLSEGSEGDDSGME